MFGIEQAFAATTEETVAAGIIAGSMMTISLVTLVICVLLIVARWKIFTKAGEAGWKSIIPIYNNYVLFKITWTTKDFLIWLCSGILGAAFISFSGAYTTTASGSVVASSSGGNMILVILGLVALLVCLVWSIRQCFKMAAAYGKGAGFGFGLLILPTIFTLILGFGSAEYVGPQE